MSNTVKQLGFIPTNRGEYDTTGQTKYYKDNVVQYRNGSYICTPVGYSSSNPTAYTTDAPYQDGDTQLNPNWKLMASVGLVDTEPTAESANLVESGGVQNELALGAVYDVSAHNGGTVFESLSALLSNVNLNILIPIAVRKGGMSIKFIQGSVPSSDNKYVQYMYILKYTNNTAGNAAFVNPNNWQKINLEKELNQLDEEVKGLPAISIQETWTAYQWYTLDTPIKAGRSIKNNSSYTVYVYSNGVEQTSLPAGTTRTYNVDITQFRASNNAGTYKIYIAAVPSSVIPEIVNDYSGGSNKTLSAEMGKELHEKDEELNRNLNKDSLSPFIFRRNHVAVSGMTQIDTIAFKAGYSYRLIVYTEEVLSESIDYYTRIYNGDTQVGKAIITRGTTSGQSALIQVTEDLNDLVLRSEINKPFTYEIKVIANSDTFMANGVLEITKLKDYAEEPLLLDKYHQGSNTDYSSMIEELFIPKDYRTNINYVTIRNYNSYVYLKAIDYNNGILWVLRRIIHTSTPNNAVLQLDSVSDTQEKAYIVFKDVAAFKALATDVGNGQEVNLKLVYRLFTQPKIETYLKQNLPSPISPNYIETSMLKDKSVTKDKLADGVSLAKGVYITLPDNIYAVVGDCLQIFFRGIINASNPYIYDIIAVSSKGKSYPRYWICTPSVSDIGTTATLTIKVRDNNLHVVAQKTTTLHFIDKISSPSSNKNLLCIGASNTTAGLWVGELRRRLTTDTGDGTPSNPIGLNLTNITFVGRKVGTSVNVPLEATGGWKVATYASQGERAFRFQVSGVSQLIVGNEYTLNGGIFVVQEINITEGSGNIRCTLNSSLPTIPASGTLTRRTGSGDSTITYSSYGMETFSPFWNDNTNKLDFVSYANAYCNGAIDVMIWHCGTNDIFSGFDIDIDRAINGYIAILRQFHIDFPNGKVIISSIPIASVTGGFGANYGSSEYYNSFTFANQARKFVERLVELCNDDEFSSYTEYCPALETYDSENGYPTTDSPVNHRDSATEKLGTNGVHYTTVGQKLIADALYRSINKILA